MCADCVDVCACFVYIQNNKVQKMQNTQNMQLCYHNAIRMYSKKKRNAITLIEDSMDRGTDNSSAFRAIIVTVPPKPILFGREVSKKKA